MAAPRFDHPMYEALDRYDRNWLIPGIGAIPEPDLVTLLQTNGRFVEAFLVGLNHEFARELLWREYPTDGRATCFRSFWTTSPELVADLHAFDRDAALGGHVDPTSTAGSCCWPAASWSVAIPGLLAHAVQHAEPRGRPAGLRAATPRARRSSRSTSPRTCCWPASTDRRPTSDADRHPDQPARSRRAGRTGSCSPRTRPSRGSASTTAIRGCCHLRDDLTWPDLLPAGERFLRPSPPRPVDGRPAATDAGAVAGDLGRDRRRGRPHPLQPTRPGRVPRGPADRGRAVTEEVA